MFPLPELPLVPKLHRFFEPEQAKTFMLIFGIALTAQSVLPGGGIFHFGAGSIWPLLVGAGFLVLTFVPGLADKLKPNLLFLIVAGAGALGVLWSYANGGGAPSAGDLEALARTAAAHGGNAAAVESAVRSIVIPVTGPGTPAFWSGGFGLIGFALTLTSLFLWARNGYRQLYWTLLISGLGGLALGLLIPWGLGLPLIAIFTQIGGGIFDIIAGIVGCVLCLGFIFLLVLVVMNVLIKKEAADPEQVERLGSTLFVAALAIPLVVGLLSLSRFSPAIHQVLILGSFLWLTVWGLVCFFEARERGENLLQLA